MNKKILLLLTCIILSGCKAEYNITITDDAVLEETVFQEDYPYEIDEIEIQAEFKNEYPIYEDQDFMYYAPYNKLDEYTYYDKVLTKEFDMFKGSYKAEYDFENYERSRLLNTTFSTYNISLESNRKFISTSNKPIILKTNNNLSKIIVNITIDDIYQVTKNNADKINNNTYTWEFNKDSQKAINIYFEPKRTNDLNNENNLDNSNKNEQKNTNDENISQTSQYIIAFLLLSAFSAILFLLIKLKKKKL